jgi:ubiquinone/menaquinone biosynthesis C-methylase UbiE
MARRLQARVAQRPPDARPRFEVTRAPAEALPLADASADVAVCTLVLCTVSDPDRALAEIRRVLRPGGALLFLEHVRSDDPARARWQDRLDPLWRRWGHGCRCNRPTADTIAAAGFQIDTIAHGWVPKAPPIVRPLIAGRAIAPRG